jgi:hypothetical protein
MLILLLLLLLLLLSFCATPAAEMISQTAA